MESLPIIVPCSVLLCPLRALPPEEVDDHRAGPDVPEGGDGRVVGGPAQAMAVDGDDLIT